ncbi:MAG: DEAD/DEAH box helicase [Spirochaetaceae bacterium]
MAGISDAGFTEPTPVQVQTFSHTLAGRDVTVQSQTGTGKTAAFLISIFELLTQNNRYKGSKALVVAPTRELAVQIDAEAQLLGVHTGLKTGCFYGGVGYGKQEEEIARGVDIIIGTPGRLLDFCRSGKLDFMTVRICVIDEADRLFDMGFYPDIQEIMRKMVDRTERTTMLFSATLSTKVLNIAWKYMNDPVEVEIEPEQITVDRIEQSVYHVARDEKLRLLLGVLQTFKPRNALIFTNTKAKAEEVSKRLSINGYSSRFIMGDLPQSKRLRIIEDIKSGKNQFVVATDVAARGIHIDDLELVVNYDVPEDPESYVHRIGRTARAGLAGKAITLACEQYVFGLEAIEELIGKKIPLERFEPDMLGEDRSAGMNVRHDRNRESGRRSGDRKRPDRRSDSPRSRQRSRSGPQRSHLPDGRAVEAASSHGPSGGKVHSNPSPDVPGAHGGGRKKPSRNRHRNTEHHTRQHSGPSGPRKNNRERDSATPALEDRLERYRQKYGEDFVPKHVETTENAREAVRPSAQKSRMKSSGQTDAKQDGTSDKPAENRFGGFFARLFGRK